jgi:hypothetical protein
MDHGMFLEGLDPLVDVATRQNLGLDNEQNNKQ